MYEEDPGYAPVYFVDDDETYSLWSEILPGLWMGGTDDSDTIDYGTSLSVQPQITQDNFDLVVTLYAWAKPVDWHVQEIRYGFYDDKMSNIDLDVLNNIVEQTYQAWKSGKKVLVRCQAGLNRSGLTMALVLMRSGMSAAGAIELMREKRTKYAVCNKEFEKYLLNLDRN